LAKENIIYIYYIMAIIPTGKAILFMTIVLSPTIITVMILIMSFTEGNFSGIVYLSGMILAQILGFLSRPFLKGYRPDIKKALEGDKDFVRDRRCSIIEDPYFSKYSSPSFHALFFSFTFIYHFLAKFQEGFESLSWIKFFILLIFWITDSVFRISMNCVEPNHYFYGCFFGLACGVGWYYLVLNYDKDLLINVESDSKKCEILNSNMTCKMVEVDDKGTETGRELEMNGFATTLLEAAEAAAAAAAEEVAAG